MTELARDERAALCDLLDRLGPDAPTLCEGWLTRDLAGHLVLREARPDAAPGIVIDFWSGWTKRVQETLAAGDYTRLVNRLRAGPPRWSPFRLRRLGEAGNGVEFFVHHEDARRAEPGWRPRQLTPDVDRLLWARARRMAGIVLRRLPAGVELVRTGTGERHMARAAKVGQQVVTLSGSASELLLYLYGRRDHALVEREGDTDALDAVDKA
jgi:uncharacterized protein (TIGR03085 family)